MNDGCPDDHPYTRLGEGGAPRRGSGDKRDHHRLLGSRFLAQLDGGSPGVQGSSVFFRNQSSKSREMG